MAKFGKFLRSKIITKWRDNYINYKSLKHFIKVNNDPCKLIYFLYFQINSKCKFLNKK